MRVIKDVGEYRILEFKGRGFVVRNMKGEYENHGHFKKLSTCYLVIKLVRKKLIPKSAYLRTSCLRLSLDKSYVMQLRKILR